MSGTKPVAVGAANTVTIGAAATSVVVAHKLSGTPKAGGVDVTPASAWGSSTQWWVDTFTATSFTIRVNIAPGGTGFVFGWRASL